MALPVSDKQHEIPIIFVKQRPCVLIMNCVDLFRHMYLQTLKEFQLDFLFIPLYIAKKTITFKTMFVKKDKHD